MSYQLDSSTLRQVLRNIRSELRTAKISDDQQMWFHFLQITSYSLGIALFLLLLVNIVPMESSLVSLSVETLGADTSPLQRVATFRSEVETRFGGALEAALYFVGGICVVSLLVLVPLNLPLMRKLWIQGRLARELQLVDPTNNRKTGAEALERSWEESGTRRRELGRKMPKAVLVVGVWLFFFYTLRPLALLLLAAALFLGLVRLIEKIPLSVYKYFLVGLTGLLVLGIAVLFFDFNQDWILIGAPAVVSTMVVATSRFMQLACGALERLDEAENLAKSLDRKLTDTQVGKLDKVEMSFSEALALESLERAVVQRDRMRALDGARGKRQMGLAVFRTPAARREIAALEPSTRLAVEDRLDKLTFDPPPEGARPGTEDGSWLLTLRGQPVEIECRVEPDAVRVTAVRSGGDGETSNG